MKGVPLNVNVCMYVHTYYVCLEAETREREGGAGRTASLTALSKVRMVLPIARSRKRDRGVVHLLHGSTRAGVNRWTGVLRLEGNRVFELNNVAASLLQLGALPTAGSCCRRGSRSCCAAVLECNNYHYILSSYSIIIFEESSGSCSVNAGSCMFANVCADMDACAKTCGCMRADICTCPGLCTCPGMWVQVCRHVHVPAKHCPDIWVQVSVCR
jgi:hypothetical protein